MQAINIVSALLHQCLAIAGQLAQGANGGRRNETRLQQAVPQQIGDPLGVSDIRLLPGTARIERSSS
jgi:hypothetical protein